LKPLLETADPGAIGVTEDGIINIQFAQLLGAMSPQSIDVALDTFVTDHLPLSRLSPDGEDEARLTAQCSGARDVPPLEVSRLADSNTAVSQDQDVLLEVEPLPPAPPVTRLVHIRIEVNTQLDPFRLGNIGASIWTDANSLLNETGNYFGGAGNSGAGTGNFICQN
jgi:hypothetical protein